jgi:hypothetical protein
LPFGLRPPQNSVGDFFEEMGMMSTARLAAMSALFAVGLATSAQANMVLDFSVTSTTGNASWQITTTDGPGSYTVLSITGTVDGNAITGLSNYGGGDEMVFDPPGNLVDRAGLAFTVGTLQYNIFARTATLGDYGFCVSTAQPTCAGGEADTAPAASFRLTTASAVPGPIVGAGLPGLLAAFGGIFAWRRRKAVTA